MILQYKNPHQDRMFKVFVGVSVILWATVIVNESAFSVTMTW